MSRLGTMVDRIDERRPGADLPLLSVSQTRGVLRQSELFDRPPRAESLDAYKVCRRGDVVFNKMSIRAGALGVAKEDGLVTYHYEVLRPRPAADARYIVYLAKSDWFIGELIKRERGIGAGDQANVRTTEVPFRVLRTIDAYLPELSTQHAIADFIDRETGQIDILIEEQQRLITLLCERRRAEFDSVLTSGATGRPMRLKHTVSAITQGWSPQAYPWPADGVAEWGVLKAGAANNGVFKPAENKQLPDEVAPRPDLVVRRGQIVVSRANTRDLVGSAALVEDDFPRLMLCDKLFAFDLDETRACPAFVAMTLNTSYYRRLLEAEATGSSHSMQNISLSDITNLPLSLPSVPHQREIVQSVRARLEQIDRSIAEAERFVELAAERRSALVTAAVTGQIDVGVVA